MPFSLYIIISIAAHIISMKFIHKIERRNRKIYKIKLILCHINLYWDSISIIMHYLIGNYFENDNINPLVLVKLKSVWKLASNRPCSLNVALDKSKEGTREETRNERESDVERKKEYAMKGDLTRGFWGLVEGGVSMWGLKGVAWQPPPALRNGRHTRHTHTPPSSFAAFFSLSLSLFAVFPSPFS